jgi:hypothetical protein
MHVMQISKHSPETCPDYHPEYRKISITWGEKLEPTAAKYGVKIVGVYNDHPAHLVYIIYDTPKMENLMGMMMEPDMMAPLSFSSSTLKVVMTLPEIMAMMKK